VEVKTLANVGNSIVMVDKELWASKVMKVFPNSIVEIIARKEKKEKSRSLEKYWWSVVVPLGAKLMGVSNPIFHEEMLTRHAPRETAVIDGIEKLFIKRTSLEAGIHMTKEEHVDWVKQCILDIEEFYGEHVPEPNE
jgi:hypothetical protein